MRYRGSGRLAQALACTDAVIAQSKVGSIQLVSAVPLVALAAENAAWCNRQSSQSREVALWAAGLVVLASCSHAHGRILRGQLRRGSGNSGTAQRAPGAFCAGS